VNGVRAVVRGLVPRSVILARRRRLLRRTAERFATASNSEIFSEVYAGGMWGRTDSFNSGTGTRNPVSSQPYVAAVTEFLATLPARPSVVDLGCGDFHVGRQIYPACTRYVACDVVPSLIEQLAASEDAASVEFRCLDITIDPLPPGDVVLIRQVLQHLSNAAIATVVPQLAKYRYAIITEHHPAGPFPPNLDIPTGPHIRVGLGSGVDLGAAPFSLPSRTTRELCVVPGEGGVIRTTLYEIA
jgi:SAM-dependent methyltransferase